MRIKIEQTFYEKTKNLHNLVKKYYPQYKNIYELYIPLEESYFRYKKNLIVLDAGCSHGSTLKNYKKHIAQLIGIDADPNNIKKNKICDKVIIGNLENLPFENEKFDIIACQWVLEHLKNPNQVFKEFSRVLKKDGILMIITSNVYNPIMFIGKILPKKFIKKILKLLVNYSEEDYFPTYYRSNSVSKISGMCKKYNLKKIKEIRAQYPYYFIFNKLLFIITLLVEKITLKNKGFFKMHFGVIYKKTKNFEVVNNVR